MKRCIKCTHPFSISDVFFHVVKIEDNRIYCSECLETNYVTNEYQSANSKILRFLLSWLWVLGLVLGFMVVEVSLRDAPYKVISMAHPVMAFLGAMLGLGISKISKELLKFTSGDISQMND